MRADLSPVRHARCRLAKRCAWRLGGGNTEHSLRPCHLAPHVQTLGRSRLVISRQTEVSDDFHVLNWHIKGLPRAVRAETTSVSCTMEKEKRTNTVMDNEPHVALVNTQTER